MGVRLDISRMMTLKGRMIDIMGEPYNHSSSGELNHTLWLIREELDKISNNVLTSSLKASNDNLKKQVNDVSLALKDKISRLTDFLGQQIDAYKLTNKDTKDAVEGLVSLITEVYDENGNINSSAQEILSKYNKMADPTITDSSSYENGSTYMSGFEGKIGSRWEVVDTTYYFFKNKGLSDEQIAGILGNMAEESELISDRLSYDENYKGLFQFGGGRRSACSEYGWDVEPQLEYVWHELQTTESNAMKDISAQTTVKESVASWAEQFERCGMQGRANREKWADACYKYIKDNL